MHILRRRAVRRAFAEARESNYRRRQPRRFREETNMDGMNNILAGGSLQISTEALAKIARCAALEIDGVTAVSCAGQKNVRDLLELVSIQQPVSVVIKDGTAEVTIQLMVAFGAKVPVLAEKVQQNVKSAIQNMTGVTVSQVNIIVAGLRAAPAAAAQTEPEKAE